MKTQALANHLAENPVDDEYESLNTYFPDEEVNLVEEVVQDDSQIWKLYFDGAVNIKGVGIGTILVSPTGQHYPATARLHFFCTNNTAEYEACIMGLNMAINLNVHELLVMYIPRFHNELVDALATLASMLPYPGSTHIDPLEIQIQDQHGYCNTIEAEPDGEPWYRDIKQCVDAKEAEMIMNEMHSRVCGPHMIGYVLAKKILRAGYYWLTMEQDCFHFVRKCHQCQIHSDLIHLPHFELYHMSAPWPFVAWGMDVIGPYEPKYSNGHNFILVAIDYFTKWVEAITLKVVTKKAVVDFVHSNIICRFGIPKTIITDNAANLNSHLMKEEEAKGKFAPNWQGPYLIKKVLSKGALHLADIEGKVTDISVNADAIKRYYA
nr:uncharacterized protein LOC117279188 [Nicotiana tomentosiformis]